MSVCMGLLCSHMESIAVEHHALTSLGQKSAWPMGPHLKAAVEAGQRAVATQDHPGLVAFAKLLLLTHSTRSQGCSWIARL